MPVSQPVPTEPSEWAKGAPNGSAASSLNVLGGRSVIFGFEVGVDGLFRQDPHAQDGGATLVEFVAAVATEMGFCNRFTLAAGTSLHK